MLHKTLIIYILEPIRLTNYLNILLNIFIPFGDIARG
ncbi:hypothetical protein SAMN05443144_108180 [Fodinibius roseus]|uniref:Uncharacterized protein n=1 Tax=Fodinibius roseus TaxID=1194090 RepID=A0A1M5BML7_9BACT|nr:hypothetical protein SAMN05443144_108180 [Fodinibius roseus]